MIRFVFFLSPKSLISLYNILLLGGFILTKKKVNYVLLNNFFCWIKVK